jgi:hypothetical protein
MCCYKRTDTTRFSRAPRPVEHMRVNLRGKQFDDVQPTKCGTKRNRRRVGRAKKEVHHASGVAHTSSHSLSLPFVGYT